jgi:hypothetical protein
VSGMSAPSCATPDSNASSSAQGWGETPAVQRPPRRPGRRGRPAATDAAIPNLPGPPYLDRDAERAYLTQIIKDYDLVFAFLAHRFFRWE